MPAATLSRMVNTGQTSTCWDGGHTSGCTLATQGAALPPPVPTWNCFLSKIETRPFTAAEWTSYSPLPRTPLLTSPSSVSNQSLSGF
ncbi:hypothetical protein E2C01_098048 [Portunus trituberculatus]|uniref:Uncharacterized protein n=1 Tax=Portunus trituberculatus TaxID=210409 RepID=A0A5B7K1Z0_PORTR|nr:hypothetical protein [Portunus trituberculatus]